MTGEAASRTSLDLPGTQQALLEELKKTGKPIILVLMSGRPNSHRMGRRQCRCDPPRLVSRARWAAMRSPTFCIGDYNPSGKLPVTFPRNVGQVPIHYDMKNTGRPIELGRSRCKICLALPQHAQHPALSVRLRAELHQLRLFAGDARQGQRFVLASTLTASVTVTNNGARDGEEVVQLYVRDLVGSVTRPVKELKGFEKIMLKKGEKRTIRFTLTDADLAFTRQDMSWGSEPGEYKLWIGPSSAAGSEASFTLTE